MKASHRVKTLCFFLIGFCGAFLPGRPICAQETNNTVGGILVSPTAYRIQVRSGQKSEVSLKLANPGLVANSIRVSVRPYLPEEWSYSPQYDASYPQDASSWFAERDSIIDLSPGAKTVQKLKFSVPARLSGSYWCVLQCVAKPAGSRSTANVAIDVPVLFTVGRGARPQVKVSSPILKKQSVSSDLTGTSFVLAEFPMQNDGAGYATVGMVSKLKNAVNGRVIRTFNLAKANLFPGTKRLLRPKGFSLPDGNYVLEFRARLGDRLLPAVVSRYVVVNGEPKPESEASIMELPPLSFDPGGIFLTVPGGSMRSQALRITNLSERPITVDMAAQSLEQTSSGILGLGSPALPSGLTARVTPSFLTIRPRSTASARVTLGADKSVEGDLWFGVAVTERGNVNALSETINGRVYVDGTGKPMMELADAKVEVVNGRPMGLRFTIRNTGNQALQLVPTAVVLKNGIQLVSSIEVPVDGSGGILPGVTLPNMVMLPPDLEPGEYIVEVSYQYGEKLYARLRVPIKVEDEKTPATSVKAPVKNPAKAPVKPGPKTTKTPVKEPMLPKPKKL